MGIGCIHSFKIVFLPSYLFWSSKKETKKSRLIFSFLKSGLFPQPHRPEPLMLFGRLPPPNVKTAGFLTKLKRGHWPLSKTIENQRSRSGQEIKSCLTLKGEFFLSVAGVSVVFSYGFWGSLDFLAWFILSAVEGFCIKAKWRIKKEIISITFGRLLLPRTRDRNDV